MHKPAILFLACLCFLLSAMPYHTKANNAAAGEISYEWIADSTYRFYFKFYRDCSGNTEPSTVPLCFHNPCNVSQSFSVTLSKLGAGSNLPVGCSAIKTKCDSAASVLNGYTEWVYSELISLPSRCNAWHIFTYISNRNSSVNIQNPTTTPFYAEVRFNNTGSFQVNSSPYATVKPIAYVALGKPFAYNSNIIDPDGDSVTTEVVNTLTNVSSCADTVAGAVTYVTATPTITVPGNPFQSNNTFFADKATGRITFTSSQAGRNTVALRIKEYRSGILIGYVTRELQVQSISAPTVTAPAISFPNASGLKVCANMALTFSWTVYSSDTNAILKVSDNHITATPGATVTYTHQGSDSVKGTFSWTPTYGDAGTKTFTLRISDSTCTPPGIVTEYLSNYTITVLGKLSAGNDTSICIGDRGIIVATGGDGTYTWIALPGSSSTTITCPTCKATYVKPATNTKYVVFSGTQCPPVTSDTMEVNVATNQTYPYIAITMTPMTDLTPATTVTFTATVSNCANPVYQWFLNRHAIPGATAISYSASGFTHGDQLYCALKCTDSCPRPQDTISNSLNIDYTTNIAGARRATNIHIYPNPNNGSFMLQAQVYTTTCKIEIMNTVGQIVYKDNLPVLNSQLHQQLKLDIPPGIYLLKLNNDVQRFIVNDKQ